MTTNHDSLTEFQNHLNALKASSNPNVLGRVQHIENLLPQRGDDDYHWGIEDTLDHLRDMADSGQVEPDLSYHIDFLRSLIGEL